MNQESFDKYLAGHIKQIALEEDELKNLAGEAMEKAQRIADRLADKCKVNKIYLFGSLARGDLNLNSDIDLAVTGLPEELYLKAYGIAESIATPLKVDLVLLEGALASLRDCVLKEGKLLYDLQREKNCPPEKA